MLFAGVLMNAFHTL